METNTNRSGSGEFEVASGLTPSGDGDGAAFRRDDFPALYAAASAATAAAQRHHKWVVRTELLLLVAASTVSSLESAASDPPDGLVTAIRVAAASLLAAAFVAKFVNRYRAFDTVWFDGRAIAETVKSATWRYAMRAEPFDAGDDAADAAFVARLREAVVARPAIRQELYRLPTDRSQITPAMRRVRASPLADRKRLYVAERAVKQLEWYATKARANHHAAARWFWVSVSAEGLALVFAIVRAAAWGDVDLTVSWSAAISAAATAWSQFGRNDELAKSYGLAAQELTFVRDPLDASATEEDFALAVVDTELTISREHTMWSAKRS